MGLLTLPQVSSEPGARDVRGPRARRCLGLGVAQRVDVVATGSGYSVLKHVRIYGTKEDQIGGWQNAIGGKDAIHDLVLLH